MLLLLPAIVAAIVGKLLLPKLRLLAVLLPMLLLHKIAD